MVEKAKVKRQKAKIQKERSLPSLLPFVFLLLPFLLDRNDRRDLGDFFAQVSLDAHLKRHCAAGAAVAGAVEADLDNAIILDVYQLDIATVGLDCGTNEVDHALNPIPYGGYWLLGSRGSHGTSSLRPYE
jgi:hypothetical protein